MSGIRNVGNNGTQVGGITVNTPYETDDGGVKVDDFLNLMIAQMTNQDFMNPADDSQYVTQMAQFATMQSMQELSYYSQTSYVSSLVGKTVTVASLGLGGSVKSETGVVTSISLSNNEYLITVNGKQYELNQIMNINSTGNSVTQTDLENAGKMQPIVNKQGENSISIRWEAPISDELRKGELRYDVYITDNGQVDFSSLAGVKKNGELVGEDLTDTNFDITGLEPGKTYFINIVVRNQNGDQAVYQQAVTKTKDA
ncbi:fibronectin type III domain-containing protein [Ruminococcaceae bacterium OttesenSCG-928-D13]|nr:fibronectin type III domain-containing protein [Ruminococcaceae bacterium OttesenSCG-928-D13]